MGRSQPGVGLWSPHFFVLHFFESGLTLNPHNNRQSFGLFISLYLCCVVDCINVCVIISRSVTQEVRVVTGRVSYWLLPFSFHSSCSCAFFLF